MKNSKNVYNSQSCYIIGDGVGSYPSDPTKPENWGGYTGIRGQESAKAFGKN